MHLIANIGTVFIIWYGGLLVIQNTLTLGELVAFTTYLAQLVRPIRLMGMIIPAVAMAGSAGERIYEILDTHADVRDAPGAVELPSYSRSGHLRPCSFAYSTGSRSINRHIHIDANPGQIIALLGPTGSGKSTIINLIPTLL
jgi:ATP-binding cassette, subfamily B, multidrug efflux pump